MSRTKKFAFNAFATTLKEVAAIIAGFITPWVMIRYYGSDINGLVTSIVQFISYFTIIEAGLGASIIYSLYKPLAEKNFGKVNEIVSAGKKFYIKTGYIFTALVALLAIVYPLFITVDGLKYYKISILVLLLGFSGVLDFFSLAKYRTLLSADQRTYVISTATIVYKLVETAVIVIMSILKVDIVIVRLVAISSVLSRSMVLYIYIKRNYSFINYKAKPDNSALAKRWDALFLQILRMVQTGAPVVLLTFFTSLKTVSIYAIYNMIINGIKGIFEILVTSVTASFGEIISVNDKATLQKVYKTFEFAYYSANTLAYSICMVLIMPFVRLYTKGIQDVNYDLPFIGFLFVINGLLHNLKSPQSLLVNAAGLYKETKIQATIQALIILIGGVVLIPFLGLKGILIALIASNIYRDIDLVIFASKVITKIHVKYTIIRIFRLLISFVIITVPFIYIKLTPDNLIEWLLYAVLISIYALVITLISSYLFEKEELKNIINRTKRLFKK